MEEKNLKPEEKKYKPFAITARTLGHPAKLYTRVLIGNIQNDVFKATYVNAMWDTGAEYCVMSKKLARKLGYNFEAKAAVKSVREINEADFGFAYVAMVSNGELIEVLTAVIDGEVGDNYSFIIGMNLINKGALAISSTNLETVLSFTIPSPEPIDFTRIKKLMESARKEEILSGWQENMYVMEGDEAIEQLIPEHKRKNQ